ncbi:hypothetical protein GLOIN_2v1731700, partial [Rhizophagus irregularis DAOM 181602=DAOM 197198]
SLHFCSPSSFSLLIRLLSSLLLPSHFIFVHYHLSHFLFISYHPFYFFLTSFSFTIIFLTFFSSS